MVGTELLNPGVPEFDGALDEFIIDVQGISNLLKQFFFTFVEITVDGGDIDQTFQYVFGESLIGVIGGIFPRRIASSNS